MLLAVGMDLDEAVGLKNLKSWIPGIRLKTPWGRRRVDDTQPEGPLLS